MVIVRRVHVLQRQQLRVEGTKVVNGDVPVSGSFDQ